MSFDALSVRLHGVPVGELRQAHATGRLSFAYASATSQRLSLHMPPREEPYDHESCEAFFGGLLPESEQARKAIARRFGANARNTFSMLRAIGYDCAGAVSLHDPAEPVGPAEGFLPVAEPLRAFRVLSAVGGRQRKAAW